MKKTLLLGGSLLAFSGLALAEEKLIEFYGILDAGVGYQSHGLPANSSFAPSVNDYNAMLGTNPNVTGRTSLLNGPLSDPRVGVKGHRQFESGLRGSFNLETGFNLPTAQLNNHAKAEADNSGPGATSSSVALASSNNADSSLNGQIFNRSAWIGLGYKDWGDLRLGRNTAFTFDALTSLDPVMHAQLFSPLSFSGAAGGGMGVSNNLRQDNSLKYLNARGGLSYGLMYEFGNGTGVAQQGSGLGAMIGYKTGSLKLNATYQKATDAIKTSNSYTAGDISIKAYNTVGYLLGAEYAVNSNLNVKAGYEAFTLKAASDAVNLSNFGSSLYGYQIGSTTSTALTSATNLSYTGNQQTTRVLFFGGDYKLSEALKVFGGYYVIKPQAYTDSSSHMGVTNTYASVLLDYMVDPQTDAYVGLAHQSYSNTTDGAASPNNGAYAANNLMAVGVRYKF